MTAEARQRRRIRTPVLAVTAIAWAGMVAVHPLHAGWHESSQGVVGASMTMSEHGANTTGHLASAASHDSLLAVLAAWALMLVAMMAPLLIGALRHVHARTFPRRRRRAMTLLVMGYLTAWSIGGLVLVAIASSVRERPAAIATVFAAAVVWQQSPAKQRCLNRHHARPPIAAFSRAAHLDPLRFGGTTALWCFGSCGALMLLPLVSGTSHLAVMALVTIWIWAEQFDQPVAPSWRLRIPVNAAQIIAAQLQLLRPEARARVVTR